MGKKIFLVTNPDTIRCDFCVKSKKVGFVYELV